MAFGFSGGSAENIRPRPPLREDFAVIREEPNLRIAFSGDPEEEYEVERVDADGSATVVGSSSSPDILVPSQAQEHRVVAKNKELGIRGTPSVPKRELKPDHRWQMPLPRNLLDDPESFDPANTAWRVQNGLAYDGVTPNVGPNGEDADTFTFPGDSFTPLRVLPTVNTVTTGGFYLRVDSGSKNLVLVTREQDNTIHTNNSSIGTSWRWLSLETPNDIGLLRLQSNDLDAATVYILRAVLNRGSSRLFSTRSEVPQTIPDVVQGADLSNGSTDGPDTNDLSFGVDEDGVPYAVSDGDDRSGDTSVGIEGTWVARIYTPAFNSFNVARILGVQKGNAFDVLLDSRVPKWLVQVQNSSNKIGTEVGIFHNGDQFSTIAFIIDSNELRLLTSNGSSTVDLSGFTLSDDPFSLLNINTSGVRVSHLEHHPVLTEAEAEAVRQRLAGNPPDPVAPTEAWDFTAATSPHNLHPYSSDASSWGTVGPTITSDVDGVADKVEDARSNNSSRLTEIVPFDGSKDVYTANWKIKKDNDTSRFPVFTLRTQDSTEILRSLTLNTSTGDFNVGNGGSEVQTVIDDGDYWTVVIQVENTDSANSEFRVRTFPAIRASLTGNTDQSLTGSVIQKEVQVVRGDDVAPPFAPTNGSIAFPQTVPALRDSSNDLTLGSSSGADTNDGSWVAPIGMAEDGDDQLRAPTKRPTVTWVERVKYTATRAFGRSANGWKVTDSDLVVEDTNGNTVSAAYGKTIDDGTYHTLAVTIDEVGGVAEVYIDGATTPDATVDLSTVGTLKSNDVELLAEGGTIKQPAYYTRALSGEEIAYLHERLVDNPQSAHPEYTTP